MPAALGLNGWVRDMTGAENVVLQQTTPACGDSGGFTSAQTEGPYFKASSPLRTSLLETGITGVKLVVSGRVLARDCKPVAGALVDFWHADAGGNYDNTGFKLRGHQFTDANGNYRLETIFPGLYTGRTRHIHVKVQAPSQPVLTTQLYFPNEASNTSDGIYSSALLMKVQDVSGGKDATFSFVLNAAASSTPPSRPADFNGNGKVDFDDFFLFAGAFGQAGTGGNAKFDLDGSGTVDFNDFFLFIDAFGK
jgi:protocatechuate 3,4-dioxygenase beta subunit